MLKTETRELVGLVAEVWPRKPLTDTDMKLLWSAMGQFSFAEGKEAVEALAGGTQGALRPLVHELVREARLVAAERQRAARRPDDDRPRRAFPFSAAYALVAEGVPADVAAARALAEAEGKTERVA